MSKIVEDGKERYREANGQELEAHRGKREAAVLRRYEEELVNAGFWRRLVLHIKMRREVWAGRLLGDENLYWTGLD